MMNKDAKKPLLPWQYQEAPQVSGRVCVKYSRIIEFSGFGISV